ncbi:hypothetical protein LOD99_9725 [Oopsacas minuta]|uniref:Uncharacterized protein n=1 Tax=Oopsacas minuta TaxID=111878 RepID=A0AAV7KKJ2_9METZ|nr:hypothetical protein LOD99_9725 [Oopsacas minuta]
MAGNEKTSFRLKKRSKKSAVNAVPLEKFDYLTLRKNTHWLAIIGYVQPLFREPFLYPRGMDPVDVNKRIILLQSNKENEGKLQYVLQEEVKRFLVAIRDSLKNLSGPELLNKIASIWKSLFAVTIPCMTALFSQFETKMPVHKIIMNIFRDVILFKVKIKDSLVDARKEIQDAEFPDRSLIPREITHMFLILQMEIDFYPELQEMIILAMDDQYEPIWAPVISIIEERCDSPEFSEVGVQNKIQ